MRHPTADALSARHVRVRAVVQREQIDALVLVHLPNVRYVTGFGGSAAIVVVTGDRLLFITDGRYTTDVRERIAPACPGLELVPVDPTYDETLARVLEGLPGRRVGVEASHVTIGRFNWLTDRLGRSGAAIRLTPVDRVVEEPRLVKDAFERSVFAEAAAMLDDVVGEVVGLVAAGQPEFEVAAEIDYRLKRRGFEGPSFDTIVASGPNAALPHAKPGERVLQAGDLVVLDFGGVLGGYCVDITRTVAVGEPSADARELYSAVAEAHAAAMARIRAGVKASDVDDAARRVLEGRGLGPAFSHSTGHGLGLEIHEEPRIGPIRPGTGAQQMARDETLAEGMVMTVEPGAYVPGRGGVRIEDDVLVTRDGCVVLTQSPRELYVVRR
jgi:Xaa-Pro aminopeptidase